MTREEAINIMKVIVHMLEDNYDTDRVEEAVEMAIKALEQEPKTGWIPVSEKLPDSDGRYLTQIVNEKADEMRYMMICDYITSKPFSLCHEKAEWFPDDETASNNVVAWMPLPNEYLGSEE